jgi:hypothetical protein
MIAALKRHPMQLQPWKCLHVLDAAQMILYQIIIENMAKQARVWCANIVGN